MTAETPIEATPAAFPGRDFAEMRPTGLLWLINSVVFHPRGYALALRFAHGPDGQADYSHCTGWELVGDGTEPWTMGTNPPTDEERAKFGAMSLDELFAATKALMP